MWYDLIVLGILLVTAYRGLQRGVIYQLAAIASVVLCFVFAEAISAAAAPMVPLQPPLNNWVVMVGAFVAFSFVSFGAARVLDAAVEKAKMKEFNRHLGAAFGFVKGVALCLVLTFFLVTMSTKTHDALADSRAARVATSLMYKLHPVMPENLQIAVTKYLRQAEQLGHPTTQIAEGNGTPDGEDELGQSVGWPGDDGLPDDGFDPFNNGNTSNKWDGGPTLSDPTGIPDPRIGGRPNDGSFGRNNGIDPRSTESSNPYSVEAIIARLPYTVTSDGERYLREILNRASAAERPALEQQIRSSGPRVIADYARQYFGVETSTGQPAGNAVRNTINGMARDEYERQFGTSTGSDVFGEAAGQLYDRRMNGSGNSFQDDAKDVVGDVARNLLNRGRTNGPSGGQPSGSGSTGGSLRDLAGGFLNNQFGQPRPSNSSLEQMRDLAATFDKDPVEQANIVAKLQKMFANTPPDVAIAAMADWTADRRQGVADPDPSTDARTEPQLRIRRATERVTGTQMGSGNGPSPFQ